MPSVTVDADVLRLLVLHLPASAARGLKPQLDLINFQIATALRAHDAIHAPPSHGCLRAGVPYNPSNHRFSTYGPHDAVTTVSTHGAPNQLHAGAVGMNPNQLDVPWLNAWLTQPAATGGFNAPAAVPSVNATNIQVHPPAQQSIWHAPPAQQGGLTAAASSTAPQTSIDDLFDVPELDGSTTFVPGVVPSRVTASTASATIPLIIPSASEQSSSALPSLSAHPAHGSPPHPSPRDDDDEDAGSHDDDDDDDDDDDGCFVPSGQQQPVFRFSAQESAAFRNRICALPAASCASSTLASRLTAKAPAAPAFHPYATVFTAVVAALQLSPGGITTRELMKDLGKVAADGYDLDTREGARQLRHDYRKGMNINTFVSHIGSVVCIDTVRLTVRSSDTMYDGIRLRHPKTPYHTTEQPPIPTTYLTVVHT